MPKLCPFKSLLNTQGDYVYYLIEKNNSKEVDEVVNNTKWCLVRGVIRVGSVDAFAPMVFKKDCIAPPV